MLHVSKKEKKSMKPKISIKNLTSNPLTAVWFGAFVDILVLSTLNPFLPRILLDMGATIPQTGLLLSVNIFIGFFSGILWGALSDKYGRRPILIVCLAGTLAGNILLAFSTSIPLFLAARVIDGIFARNTQIILTIIGDLVPPGKRSKEMSKPGAGWIAGGLVGPVIGGALYRFGIQGLAAFSSVLYASNTVLYLSSYFVDRLCSMAPSFQLYSRAAESGLARAWSPTRNRLYFWCEDCSHNRRQPGHRPGPMPAVPRGRRPCHRCRPEWNHEIDALGIEIVDAVDVTRPEDVARLSQALADTSIDILINSTAILRSDAFPALEPDAICDHFEVNTLGPLRVSLALLDRLHAGSKLIFITSRVGSLADNSSGGNYGYRMSKTALNMMALNLSMDLAPRGIPVALLHPGYVRTGMTGFNGMIDVQEAADGLVARIDELTLETTGCFLHANGDPLPW